MYIPINDLSANTQQIQFSSVLLLSLLGILDLH